MLIRTTKTRPVETGPMSGPTSGSVNADTGSEGGAGGTAPGSAEAPRGAGRRVWVAILLAIVVLVGVATVTITAEQEPGQEVASAAAASGPAVGSQEFLLRLAEQGYIPHAAVDRELLLLQRAVARGDIPAASLDAPASGTPSLSTPGERLLIEAVASGQVPAQALDPGSLEGLHDEARSSAAYTARLDGVAERELGR